MPSRDVQINLVGNDRTGRATRSAANNLDRLAAKIDRFNNKTAKVGVDSSAANKLEKTFAKAGDDAGKSFAARFRRRITSVTEKIRVKIDVDKGAARIRSAGIAAGNLFTNAMANVINDGSRAFGNALRAAFTKLPALGPIGALIATRLLGFIGQTITAGFGLLLGPGLLAAPIAFLLKKQLDANKQVTASEKRIASLKKQLEAAKGKDVQARLRKEIAAEQRVLAEQQKQAAIWIRLKTRAKDFLTFISKPLKVPFQKSLEAIGDGLEKLKGPMRDIMAALGPALAPFTKGVMDGLLAFIKALQPALPGIVAGMKAWGAAMPRIGKALGHMIAQIMKDPDRVVIAIEGIVTAIEDLAVIGASVIRVLTSLGNGFTIFARNIDALETGKLGQLTGFFRIFGTVAHQAVILALSALDALFSSLARIPFVGAIFKGAASQIHGALLQAQTDFNNTKAGWIKADETFKRRQIKAKITAEIADLEGKVAAAKAKLDTVKNKKTRAKITADIKGMELKIAVGKSKLATLGKTVTKPKIQARIDQLQAKIKTARSSLRGVHNSKTIAKVNANIRKAEAEIRRLKGMLKGIPDEQVNVVVNPVVNFSKASLRRMVLKNTAGESFALSGGSDVSRTGGPSPVNVAAPIVNVNASLGGVALDARITATVRRENSRDTYRARVGARR